MSLRFRLVKGSGLRFEGSGLMELLVHLCSCDNQKMADTVINIRHDLRPKAVTKEKLQKRQMQYE